MGHPCMRISCHVLCRLLYTARADRRCNICAIAKYLVFSCIHMLCFVVLHASTIGAFVLCQREGICSLSGTVTGHSHSNEYAILDISIYWPWHVRKKGSSAPERVPPRFRCLIAIHTYCIAAHLSCALCAHINFVAILFAPLFVHLECMFMIYNYRPELQRRIKCKLQEKPLKSF